MPRLRVQTQLLIATVLIISGLTASLLFIIHHTIGTEIHTQIREGTEASVRAFESVQQQRETQLSRSAAMLSDLPTLKALMTTEDAPTIQDGSATYWKMAGSDLFVLAKPDKRIMALHSNNGELSTEAAQRAIERSVSQGEEASWWYEEGKLYWVFMRPIVAGSGNTSRMLGLLAIGYQVDTSVADQLAVVAGNQIALETDRSIIASTLPQRDADELQRRIRAGLQASNPDPALAPKTVTLPTDQYEYSTVLLGAGSSSVRCYVMMPLVGINNFMRRLNRTIYFLAASAILLGALIFGFVARTITSPLDNLVSGVQELAKGNYNYSIVPRGSSEVATLSTAFSQMRDQLLASQQQQIEVERVAALGRAASSISHDLRHYLAAVMANAEFLYEADKLKLNKHEIFDEIKMATNQMTDLIDSLRELSSQRKAISPQPGDLSLVIQRAMEAVHARLEFRNTHLDLITNEELNGSFDPNKLERVFVNLILNACEATGDEYCNIAVRVQIVDGNFEVRVCDRGPGVPSTIRETLFDPFVSYGKPNGTGMGLAIVQKIVQDHGGLVCIEETSETGTIVLVKLPRAAKGSPIPSKAVVA
jgi:signal transduction histidine kinase